MPPELLAKVFGFVDARTMIASVPRVCKTWRAAAALAEADLDFRWHRAPLPFEAAVAIGALLPSARALTLGEPHAVIDPMVAALAGPRLRRAVFLQTRGITAAAVATLAETCPLLESVEFFGCRWHPDAIAALAACRELAELSVPCSDVSEAAVAAVAEGCPKLRRVDFTGSRGLTDGAVLALATARPELEAVDVEGCFALTNEAADALSEHCRGLREITMNGCDRLTPAAVAMFKERCPKLKSVDFGFIGPEVAAATFFMFRERCAVSSAPRLAFRFF